MAQEQEQLIPSAVQDVLVSSFRPKYFIVIWDFADKPKPHVTVHKAVCTRHIEYPDGTWEPSWSRPSRSDYLGVLTLREARLYATVITGNLSWEYCKSCKPMESKND
jgi:hypothetical protein